jgi:hypothetical protein
MEFCDGVGQENPTHSLARGMSGLQVPIGGAVHPDYATGSPPRVAQIAQSSNDRAEPFWAHQLLAVEECAGLPDQFELRFEILYALAGPRQFVGLVALGAGLATSVDQCLLLLAGERRFRYLQLIGEHPRCHQLEG